MTALLNEWFQENSIILSVVFWGPDGTHQNQGFCQTSCRSLRRTLQLSCPLCECSWANWHVAVDNYSYFTTVDAAQVAIWHLETHSQQRDPHRFFATDSVNYQEKRTNPHQAPKDSLFFRFFREPWKSLASLCLARVQAAVCTSLITSWEKSFLSCYLFHLQTVS